MKEDYFDYIKAFNIFTMVLKDELPLTVRHDSEWMEYFDYKCKSLSEKLEEGVTRFRDKQYFDFERLNDFYENIEKDITELFAYLCKKERAKLNNATTTIDKLKYIQPRKFYRFTRWDYCLIRFNFEKERSRRKLPSTQRQGFDDKCKSITEELKGKLKELQEEENCNMMYYLAALRHYQKKMNQIHRS